LPADGLRALVLVPTPDYPEPWRWAYDVEAQALEQAGIAVEPAPWTEARDLSGFDCVLPLVVWGYHLRFAEWLRLLDRLESEPVPCINPPALLRWNSDKLYLAELGTKGVPTVETLPVDKLTGEALAEARAHFGSDNVVVKPPVSASATGTFLLRAGEGVPPEVAGQRMLVQPFVEGVATEGEYSLIFFGGRFSHAIVKRPKTGDFRVQPHLGGVDLPCAPPDGAEELARAALAAAPAEATYARVDMVPGREGLQIIELELIEPALFLHHAPDGGAAFASAVRGAVEQPEADR